MKAAALFGITLLFCASALATPEAIVQRRCWATKTDIIDIQFKGNQLLLINRANDGKSCIVDRDPTYPNAHVPPQYQHFGRYLENRPTNQSTDFGRANPCTIMLGQAMGKYDTSGVFSQLRIDMNLANPAFYDGAKMEVATMGDGAGPYRQSYICR